MFLTENEQKWSNIISEELGVKDQSKLSWMSKYAQIHEIFEGVQTNSTRVDGNIYTTPLNTMGMGNPMMPQGVPGADFRQGGIGNTGADFHNPMYQKGSGDIPMSTLTMALEVAAMTIGLELVPVIPANGPWAMLSYMDFPYAGGKLGRINETTFDGKGVGAENKPIYIKFNTPVTDKSKYEQGKTEVTVVGGKGQLIGTFMGFSRIDNNMIVEVKWCTVDGKEESENISIADVFSGETAKVNEETAAKMRPELVTGAADHIQNFTNFASKGEAGKDPMTRAENETGVGNTIGARMFTKMVQMGAYEVTGAVTRQQLQDMPLYGVDVVGKVLEAMQNEISQSINNRILDRVFRLGVTNAINQEQYQGVNLNLYLGDAGDATGKDIKLFTAYEKYVGINGEKMDYLAKNIPNAIQNTAAENITTHQRRIMSRVLAAANLIANVSRRGRAHWVVTNTQILTALQDAANFVVAPMTNNLVQDGSKSLYFAGSIAGLNVYVDPYMTWDDTRVCVGSKSTGNDPGVVFMPYILADTVQITAEGTMAPKLLVNSRFAIVDAGFYPEQRYYTFMVESKDGAYLI